ncbi:MAG TPA: sugar ABC transporter substrate-binding protein [Amycolatopsis sp.]|uniref:sugar ABC transporter substrate-binding protein n=1 Tax=Amycolatopsis sp. TaxID=37632 RepID=UPI002B4A546E|nr:sugar ABC transporter substrate-binding protein [Amycolatopsis sp.]HKS47521.1 sugar ABC transporter substrate-binding protein [Amycolatopsis sp.]
MVRLDRDRMPVRFAVVTSVVSGLILAAILKALRTGVSEGAMVVWFVLASGSVAAISWAAILTIRLVRRRSKRAFLMTSAFSQKYYVAAFVQRLHSALDRNAIDLVLKVPDRDYDASAQSHHLGRIFDRRHGYIGGIIIAGEVHRLRDDLTTFCRKSRLPVVFTDLEPFEKESEYPENSAFVGYDTGELGELAGKWLARHLDGKKRPRVLIIASREHSSRQQRCEQALRRESPDAVITTVDSCGFVRSRAYDAVRAHIRQLDLRQRLDAIFCTNDEMALGAVDALSSSLPATQATVVVGVDGVLEAKALIDTATSSLRATVVQDTHRLAVSIVDLLDKMHRGRTVPKRTILNAEIYEAG